MMQLVGLIAVAAIALAIIVLAMVSWLKHRRRDKKPIEDGGHLGPSVVQEPTPGNWE